MEGGSGSKLGNASGITFYNPVTTADGTAKNIIVSHNRCSAHYRYGITMYSGRAALDGGSANNNTCDNNGWVGIYASTASNVSSTVTERTSIAENYCNYNGFNENSNSTTRGGIVLADIINAVVSNNVCMRNGDTTLGITPVTNAAHSAGIRSRGDEIDIEGNIAGHNKDCGITTWSSPSYRMSVVGNRVLENGKDGILVQGAAASTESTTGRGFLVNSNVSTGNDDAGIRAYYMNGALISSNYCRCNDDGIKLDGNTDNVYLVANLIAYASGKTAIDPSTPAASNVYTSNESFVDSSC